MITLAETATYIIIWRELWYTLYPAGRQSDGVGKPKCCHQQSRQPDILHSCFLSSIKTLKQINLKFTSRSIQSLEKGKFERFVKTTLLMQNSKLMTTAYYRCTKMVVTKTVIGDNAMRMKSQPQLATRWLWSFASFVFNPFESILLSFDLA